MNFLICNYPGYFTTGRMVLSALFKRRERKGHATFERFDDRLYRCDRCGKNEILLKV